MYVGRALRLHCRGSIVLTASMTQRHRVSSGPGKDCSVPPANFTSAVKFRLSPSEVNETNAPTAAEVSAMLPSLHDLRQQLPDARWLREKYIVQNKEAASSTERCPTSAETTIPTSTLDFHEATDPLEDFLFDPLGGEPQPQQPTSAHVLLAYRALAWGTFYAISGFTLTVAVIMTSCGYHSVANLRTTLREKVRRDEERLRTQAVSEAADGDVVHYVIDLADPAEAWRQAQSIWKKVQQLADDEVNHV